jgi:50S ribosomal protein L16 3-hydroxylase
MTASAGFRAPAPAELARDLLQRLADAVEPAARERLYADAAQGATAEPGAIPPALLGFAGHALRRALADPLALPRALGELLTEPKPRVCFAAPRRPADLSRGLRLDRRTRMMYDSRHVFVNGEAFDAGGKDAQLLRRLADRRELGAADVARFGVQARRTLDEWSAAGWLQEDGHE